MKATFNAVRQLTSVMITGAFLVVCTSGLFADDQAFLNDFRKHLADLETISAQSKTDAADAFENLVEESQEDAVTESLMQLYPEYAKAVAAADSENVDESMRLLDGLVDSDDKYLAADSTFYLARSLMNEERYEEALPLLARVTNEFSDHTLHGPSTQYFIGVAQAGQLENKKAIESFVKFLQNNSEAPERLRVSAWRQVQQLQSIEEGKIQDVHQRMDYSRRKLMNADTGETTQTEQDKIVRMLTKLIKEEEKKECSSNNSQNQKKQQQQQKKQQQAQNKPKPKNSKSQKGGQSSNPNGQVVKKSNADAPASPWSRLRDRSRDPANNAVKEKLPARYRDLIERYYEKANGTENN